MLRLAALLCTLTGCVDLPDPPPIEVPHTYTCIVTWSPRDVPGHRAEDLAACAWSPDQAGELALEYALSTLPDVRFAGAACTDAGRDCAVVSAGDPSDQIEQQPEVTPQ